MSTVNKAAWPPTPLLTFQRTCRGGQGVVSLTRPGGDGQPPRTFTFDNAFPDNVAQVDVYNVTARPIVDSCLEGYNGTHYVLSLFHSHSSCLDPFALFTNLPSCRSALNLQAKAFRRASDAATTNLIAAAPTTSVVAWNGGGVGGRHHLRVRADGHGQDTHDGGRPQGAGDARYYSQLICPHFWPHRKGRRRHQVRLFPAPLHFKVLRPPLYRCLVTQPYLCIFSRIAARRSFIPICSPVSSPLFPNTAHSHIPSTPISAPFRVYFCQVFSTMLLLGDLLRRGAGPVGQRQLQEARHPRSQGLGRICGGPGIVCREERR